MQNSPSRLRAKTVCRCRLACTSYVPQEGDRGLNHTDAVEFEFLTAKIWVVVASSLSFPLLNLAPKVELASAPKCQYKGYKCEHADLNT